MTDPVISAVSAEIIVAALHEGGRAAALVVVEGPRSVLGQRILATALPGKDAEVHGELSDPIYAAQARELVLAGCSDDPSAPAEGMHTLASTTDEARSDGSLRVYLELHSPQPELLVVGAGHIAQPLVALGAMLDFRVRVLDDRPEFATHERFPEADEVLRVDFSDPFKEIPIHSGSHIVMVTRGHKYDYECVRRLMLSPVQPMYVGMIGSRRRVRATFSQLLDEGISRERLATVRAPLGLDLGAETPAEIAVAVMAEIVLLWRGGSGMPLADRERVLERFFTEDA